MVCRDRITKTVSMSQTFKQRPTDILANISYLPIYQHRHSEWPLNEKNDMWETPFITQVTSDDIAEFVHQRTL